MDYELELNYPQEFIEEAEGIMFFLQKFLHTDGKETPASQSEFFQKRKRKTYLTLTGSVRVRI